MGGELVANRLRYLDRHEEDEAEAGEGDEEEEEEEMEGLVAGVASSLSIAGWARSGGWEGR